MVNDKKMTKQDEKNKALAAYDYGEYAGKGFENQSNDDIAMPFIGILQSLSPELTEGDPKYIPDARAGELINTVTGERFSADKGVVIVPVTTRHCYVEWVPRDKGGGFVAVHNIHSDVVQQAKREAAAFNKLRTESGNDLIESFYLYSLQLETPDATEASGAVVLAFTSTKIRVYKRIMTILRTVRGNPPLFAHRLKVTSKSEKNKAGQPYKNFEIQPALGTVAESLINPAGPQGGLLDAAIELLKLVDSGTAKVAYETQGTGGGAADGADEEAPF